MGRLFSWIVCLFWTVASPALADSVASNDNSRPAGRLDGSVLTLRLYADVGVARPAGPKSAPIEIAAFGEEGSNLSAPGPIIRVREGTTVVVTLRNALASTLRVEGLCARPGPCKPLSIAPGSSQEVRFDLNAQGTYFYWATTATGPLSLRRPARDSQLGGAIVVDPREESPADRVFVITAFGEPPPPGDARTPSNVFAVNGASWPHTERLHHKVGDRVRWRIINLSFGPHPMHLHGFYFVIEASGDISAERWFAPGQQRAVVTEHIELGHTFVMSWTPETPGNWLFHCHMTPHMSGPESSAHGPHTGHGSHETVDSAGGMEGLVIGIYVTGDRKVAPLTDGSARKLSMVMREEPNRYGSQNGYRIDLEGVAAPRLTAGPVPGPVLVLTRGEPAEITLVNRMSEPTAIHWHGIELESYDDGVPGWGGEPGKITPTVAPGQSFVAKMTPPRAGTFIYHTHWHKDLQLTGGLYGALIVVEPGERFDPDTDHIVIIGLNGVLRDGDREPFALNGSATPAPIVMRANVPNRLRLINITASNVGLWASVLKQFDLATWKPVAKDGATLPPQQTAVRPSRQLVSVGETYDFEIQPSRGPWWLEVRRGTGEFVMQAPIRVR